MTIVTPHTRHTPIQRRSTKRIEELAAAARVALARHGRDRFTTEQVADIAGCSIGTVYRYFEDRVAILDYIWPNRDLLAFEELRNLVRRAMVENTPVDWIGDTRVANYQTTWATAAARDIIADHAVHQPEAI